MHDLISQRGAQAATGVSVIRSSRCVKLARPPRWSDPRELRAQEKLSPTTQATPKPKSRQCQCCERTPAQRAFDRHQVSQGIKTASVTCPQCKTAVPQPLQIEGFLDRADQFRHNHPADHFNTPLHLVTYQGSFSTFRKKCSTRRIA